MTAPSVNEQLLEQAIWHSLWLEEFSAKRIQRFIAFMNRLVMPGISRALQIGDTAAALRILTDSYSELYGQEREILVNLVANEANWAHRSLVNATALLKIDFRRPDVEQAKLIVLAKPFSGRTFEQWFTNVSDTAVEQLDRVLKLGMLSGEGHDAMILRASQALGKSRVDIPSILRTGVNHVSTQAREATYAENAAVIKGIQWVSTLDIRTSEICRSRDGMVFPINEGPRPPAHIRCRSTTVPVLRSWSELGLAGFGLKDIPDVARASMNGSAAASVKYEDWIRKLRT